MTIPPSDFSYFERINALVQQEPSNTLDPEIMGSSSLHRHCEGQALQSRCADEADSHGGRGGRHRHESNLELACTRIRRVHLLPGVRLDQHALRGWLQFRGPAAACDEGGDQALPAHRLPRSPTRVQRSFYFATGITPAMIMRLPDIGSQYLGVRIVDSKGEYFDGSKTYKVTLPPNIPARAFWSIIVYDNQTRSMLQTPQRYPRATAARAIRDQPRCRTPTARRPCISARPSPLV